MPVQPIELNLPEYDENITLEQFKTQVRLYEDMIADVREQIQEIRSKLPLIYQNIDAKRRRKATDYDMGDGRDGRKSVRLSYSEIRQLEKDLETLINNEYKLLGLRASYRWGLYQYQNYLYEQGLKQRLLGQNTK